MFALADGRKRRSPMETIAAWWRRSLAPSEFMCCAQDELEKAAGEFGVSPAELRRLARLGPDAADLLLRRMAALDLDRNEVFGTAPGTFQDMQRVCSMCAHHRRCARDLARDQGDPAWQGYCPNVATLQVLNALPWAARRDW